MSASVKTEFMERLQEHFHAQLIGGSRSLYDLNNGQVRLYVRYSRVHEGDKTFFGLREQDLISLEGLPSFIALLWDGQTEPLFIPFSAFEDVFRTVTPAQDGQYKIQVYLQRESVELYIARAGRFNVEAFFGWSQLEDFTHPSYNEVSDNLSHGQVQTLLGAIGFAKGYDIWIPVYDRGNLDWNMCPRFGCCSNLPREFDPIADVATEIDVIWIERGALRASALFEVEHSTPIYSGLLRFNDIHLTLSQMHSRYSIVSNDARRSNYVRQITRPTFRASGLGEVCNFLEYKAVLGWYNRVRQNNP